MKKIIAILLISASVLSLAACKGKNEGVVTEPADPNVFQSEINAAEAEQSKAIAESVNAELEVQDEIDEYIKKVGKTKKKTQLVIQCGVSEEIFGKEYWKLEFKNNGEYKTKIEYYFLPTKEQYNAKVQIAKDIDGLKLVDKDPDTRMVVIRNDNFNGRSFDKMYATYTDEAMAELGYFVIE